ncbi:MAG: hypothetical protein ACRD2X_07965, partial [Vicinamibacteraceae bacterium]
MSSAPRSSRSFKEIRRADLRKLVRLAHADNERFFRKYRRWKRLYARRRSAIVLAQGAANHFVTRRKGVNDFDVWIFWDAHPRAPMPYRRHKAV